MANHPGRLVLTKHKVTDIVVLPGELIRFGNGDPDRCQITKDWKQCVRERGHEGSCTYHTEEKKH